MHKIALAVSACLAGTAMIAGEADGRLSLELNAAESTETGCLVSFLINNGLERPIDSLILETVLLDTDGRVDRLTLFDLGALPEGRPRVRQFALEGGSCEAFSALLINGAQSCQVAGAPLPTCSDALDLSSRIDIDLLG